MKTNILITGKLHPDAILAFKNHKDYNVVNLPDCSKDILYSHLPEAHVLVSRSETDVDAELIDCGKNLKLIARAAVGVGNIDISYASKKGILIINTPGQNTNSAAELAIGLLLASMRRITVADSHMRSGGWDRHRFSGFELRNKSIGVIGLGNVGHRVVKFAKGFDMDVWAYDPYIHKERFSRYGVKQACSLSDLAAKVEILSVHTPLNKETKGMVDAVILALLPKGAYVINAARGGIVCEKALFDALESGHIAGAGIDTWDNEPKPEVRLVSHPNVVSTPHIGASTEEAQKAVGDCIVLQVKKALDGGVVDYPVNLPSIGSIDNPIVKPFALLAEKLGRLAYQLIRRNPTAVEVTYHGDLAEIDPALVRLGWMKGFAASAVDSYVSFVNAESRFHELGLQIKEVKEPDFQNFRSAVQFVILSEGQKELSVGGITFDNRDIRISMINDFEFEIEPSGNLIVIENEDLPGVVGDVGTLLAKEKVNIDSFALSRRKKGEMAMAIIKVDDIPEKRLVDEIMKLKNIRRALSISL